MTKASRAVLLVAMLGASACRTAADVKEEARELAAREQRLNARLASVKQSGNEDPIAMWIMPVELSEISGLGMTPDGRLLAHDDEIGKVYEIDAKRGVVLKRFMLGKGPHADFEGITMAGSDLYMIVSNGALYKFREGGNGESVKYTVVDTRLGKECEFEGVAFEPDSARLVMPCKHVKMKGMKDNLVLYRYRVGATDSAALSVLTVPLDQVIGGNDWKTFRPSDITIDPATGNYVIISSLEKGLIEMTPRGEVLRSEALPGNHPQAEGVAITRDSILIVSDEASSTAATITLYRWNRAGAGETTQ